MFHQVEEACRVGTANRIELEGACWAGMAHRRGLLGRDGSSRLVDAWPASCGVGLKRYDVLPHLLAQV